MSIELRDEPTMALAEHGRVAIAFEVRSVLELEAPEAGLGGLVLVERPIATPWRKDYDANPRQAPASWASYFDVSTWGLISAWDGASRIGGAVIALDAPSLSMSEDRDVAVLWDIRIAPPWRRRGVGAKLFHASADWARARGCVRLDVETQNINVAACRLYARCGCELRRIDRLAYPELPHEVELIWTKRLA